MNKPKVILCSWEPQRPTVSLAVDVTKAVDALNKLSLSADDAADRMRAMKALFDLAARPRAV